MSMKGFYLIQGTSSNIHRFGIFGAIILIVERIFERILSEDRNNILFRKTLLRKKHSIIKNYLSNKYSSVVKNMIARKNIGDMCEKGIIWVFWWQGEDDAPVLIKQCLKCLRANAGDHPVILISRHNFKNYVSIPSYILEKVNSGIISLTHFSDILRMSLLYEHGGLWLDSSILVTKLIPESVFKKQLFTRKGEQEGYFVSECRWSGFLIGGGKGCIVFDFIKKMFFEYWRKENDLIDYFLIDYCMAVAYESNPEIKRLIDDIPFNNPQLHKICRILNDPFDQKKFDSILIDTDFHKLTWEGGSTLLYGKWK